MPILPVVEPEIRIFESSGGSVVHFRLPLRGKDVLRGGITVRVGPSGVLCCLTCLRADCPHVDRVRDTYREYQRARAAAEVTA